MPNSIPALRRLLWQRRVDAARVWQEATRADAAEHDEAVRRILDQAPQIPDPVRAPQTDVPARGER
jgi:hypothetical protein